MAAELQRSQTSFHSAQAWGVSPEPTSLRRFTNFTSTQSQPPVTVEGGGEVKTKHKRWLNCLITDQLYCLLRCGAQRGRRSWFSQDWGKGSGPLPGPLALLLANFLCVMRTNCYFWGLNANSQIFHLVLLRAQIRQTCTKLLPNFANSHCWQAVYITRGCLHECKWKEFWEMMMKGFIGKYKP